KALKERFNAIQHTRLPNGYLNYILKQEEMFNSQVGNQQSKQGTGFSSTQSGGQVNPRVRLSLKTKDQSLKVFSTGVRGDCGIHAMFGAPNARGIYIYHDPDEIRENLSQYINDFAFLLSQRYQPLFLDILQRINTQLSQGKSLTGDDLKLWTSFIKIDKLQDEMKKASAEHQQRIDGNRQMRDKMVEQYLKATRSNEELIDILINKIELSNAESDAILKQQLQEKTTIEEKRQLLLQQNETTLSRVVSNNLSQLYEFFKSNNNQELSKLYEKYQEAVDSIPEFALQRVVQKYYEKLIEAYTAVLAIPASPQNDSYYLREEDLMTIADMKKRGLVIYRQQGREFNEHLSYSVERGNVFRVFHSGVHYERAELVNSDQEATQDLEEVVEQDNDEVDDIIKAFERLSLSNRSDE
ncbi:MAG: hypothetical protein WBV73_11525, partial [Phormidium sp.]